MNISLTPPPSNIDPELQRWLAQLQIEISGAIEDIEGDINEIKADIKQIKTHLGLT